MLDELYHPITPEAEVHYLSKPAVPIPKSKRRKYPSANWQKRKRLWRVDGRCYYCLRVMGFDECTLDHKVPRSQGGVNHLDNLVLACVDCNQRKGVRSVREFLSSFPAMVMPLRSFADLSRFSEGPIV